MKLFEILTLIVSIVAIVSSSALTVVNVYLKESVETRLTQQNLTNEEQNRILKSLFDLEFYLDELIAKYNVDTNELHNKITTEEKIEANKFISEVNFALSKLFIVMPDEKYETIATNWVLGPIQLREMRYKIAILMRKTHYPKTEFDDKSDIKFIYPME